MKLYTIPHRGQLLLQKPNLAWAVVIDVLRYSTTLAAGLANGALRAYPAREEEEARKYHADLVSRCEPALLCGEREGLPLPGFDLGNSPLEFTRERVAGKTLVTLTTNGTLTLRTCAGAVRILLGSFVNAPALVAYLARHNPDSVYLVCSGKENAFCIEDFACAGYVARLLFRAMPDNVLSDPHTIAACRLMADYHNNIERLLFDSNHGKYLCSLGFSEDLKYCARPGEIDAVPAYDGTYLVPAEAMGGET
ncbi:2-phosphosulfolactate phosphatase [bacterium]|nr:2-phosphosulfolactate phosphatase [bacterium]